MKRSVRSVLSLVIVIMFVLSFALTGCGGHGSSTVSSAAVNGLKTKITWARFPRTYHGEYGSPEEWVKAKIKLFNEQYPNVEVTSETIPWENWQAKISTGLASNTAPDVFDFGSWIATYYKDYLSPIDSYLGADKNDYVQTALDAGMVDGKHYVWPWFNSGIDLVVNATMAKERGVTLPSNKEGDWTMAEFLDACKKLTYNDGKTNVYAFPLYGIDPAINWGMMSIVGDFGGDVFTPDKKFIGMNTPKSINGLQFMLDLQDKYKVSPPGAAGLTIDQCNDMFIQGKVAMALNQSDYMITINQAVKDGKIAKPFDVAYVQFPTPDGASTTCTQNSPAGLVVFKQKSDTLNREKAAMALCKVITSTEETAFSAKSGNFVPIRKSSTALYPIYPNVIAAQRGKVFFDGKVDETIYAEDLTALFQSVLNHSKTPGQALKDFEATNNAKIKKYYDTNGIAYKLTDIPPN